MDIDNMSIYIITLIISVCLIFLSQTVFSCFNYFVHPYSIDVDLTHWDRGKKAAFLQMTSSNAFSWKKMFELPLKFRWSLFSDAQLTVSQDSFDLAPKRRQAIIWSNDGLVYWGMHVSLGFNNVNKDVDATMIHN